jgi:hypothetical protein
MFLILKLGSRTWELETPVWRCGFRALGHARHRAVAVDCAACLNRKTEVENLNTARLRALLFFAGIRAGEDFVRGRISGLFGFLLQGFQGGFAFLELGFADLEVAFDFLEFFFGFGLFEFTGELGLLFLQPVHEILKGVDALELTAFFGVEKLLEVLDDFIQSHGLLLVES